MFSRRFIPPDRFFTSSPRGPEAPPIPGTIGCLIEGAAGEPVVSPELALQSAAAAAQTIQTRSAQTRWQSPNVRCPFNNTTLTTRAGDNESVKVLVIDVGGTHVKLLASGRKTRVEIPSGPALSAAKMVKDVKKATAGWNYSAVSIGYPGPVIHNRVMAEPHNLGRGWVGFDFRKAFGRPVRLINDAAMQALGSYEGRRMLFLGLGTGLGSAMIVDGILEPMELAHLPYKHGRTYEDYVGLRGLKRLRKKKWRRHVADVVKQLKAALEADYVVLGGGNAKLLKKLPPGARLGDNDNAFRGGFRLWHSTRN
jgi:polyphosphate glucokinase